MCRRITAGDAARVSLAAPLPHSRRTALGVSMIRKKDEEERNGEFPRADVRRAICDGRAARASWPRAVSVRTEQGGDTGPAKACRTAGASQSAAHEGRSSLMAESCRALEDRDSEGEKSSSLSRVRQSGTHGPRYGPAPPLPPPGQTMPPGRRKAGRTDAGQRTKKDDRLPRGRSSRPKREDVLMVRGYGEGGGCSREPRQDQGGLPCRICCPPKAGRDDLRSKIRRSQEGPAGARGIPGRGRSSRGLHFVERELRLKVPVKGGCCFREPGRKEEELPARYFFLPLAGISS